MIYESEPRVDVIQALKHPTFALAVVRYVATTAQCRWMFQLMLHRVLEDSSIPLNCTVAPCLKEMIHVSKSVKQNLLSSLNIIPCTSLELI